MTRLKNILNRVHNQWETRHKRTVLKSRPKEIGIEPTNQCNADCIMCNRRFNRTDEHLRSGFLNWSVLRDNLDFIKACDRVCFSGFGEPALHPDYLKMAGYIKQTGAYVYCFSNGTLLSRENCEKLVEMGFDEISISLGGGNRSLHQNIRRIDNFGRIVKNIEFLNRLKLRFHTGKPRVSFNVVAMNSVLQNLTEIIHLAAKLKVGSITMPNLSVQGDKMREESPWNHVKESRNLLLRASTLADKHHIAFTGPDLTVHQGDCLNMFSYMFITWDGKIMSCPFERYLLGNLRSETMEQAWNNPNYQNLRSAYHNKGLRSICPECSCWNNHKGAFLKPQLNTRKKAITP